MKILRVRLKNYIGVYNGIGLKDLLLDFKDKKIILISGKNGSGKSSIMNAMHPLADSSKNIRKGKKGVKEICLEHEGIIYEIEHFYNPTATSHTIKSFIKVIDPSGNTEEMNINGNVTSFKEVIDKLIGVNDEYLSMIRLGSSFNSFIERSATERSRFISKFLSDINIYLKYHKKVTEDLRLLKSMIKSVSNKLDNIGDYESLESRLDKCKNDIVKCNSAIKNIENNIFLITNQVKELPDISLDVLDYDIRELSKNIDIVNKAFNVRLEEMTATFESTITNYKNMYDSMISSLDTNIKDYIGNVSECDESIEDMTCELELIDVEECNEIVNKYNSKTIEGKLIKEEYGFNEPSNIPKFTKSELFQAAQILDDFLVFIEDLHAHYSSSEFEDLKKCMSREYYLNHHNTIKANMDKVGEEVKTIQAEIAALNEHYKILEENYAKKPANCNNLNCHLLGGNIKEYDARLMALSKELGIKEDELDKACKDIIYYSNMIDIIDESDRMLAVYKRNIELLNKIGLIPNAQHILTCIISGDELYDAKELERLSDIVESYNRYLDIEKSINELHVYYITSIRALEDKAYMEASIISEKAKRDLYYNKLNGLKEKKAEYSKVYDTLKVMNSNIHEYTEFIEYLFNKDQVVKISNLRKDCDAKLKVLNSSLIEQSGIHGQLEELHSLIYFKLLDYNKLKKERKLLKNKFTDIEIVKDALSTNKGIPKIYIQLYLQQVRMIANGLLEEAFNSILSLDDFHIDQNEFRIPFTRREHVADISYGSAGERAIVSLVLSFAFVSQISSEFNIMFMDEIDGPLDKKNRKSFANAVETQMDIMNMEQCFIISHNDSFLTRNVGYILLDDHGLDNVNRNDIIFEY